MAFPISRSLRSLTFTLALVLAGSGCSRLVDPAADITLQCRITPQPVRAGLAEVTLELMGNKPVTGAHIRIEGDMAHPGMAPVFRDAREIHAGIYKGSFDFSMPGDWVLLMHIRLADGRTVERQVEVRGVIPNEGR